MACRSDCLESRCRSLPGVQLIPSKSWEEANPGEVFAGWGYSKGTGFTEFKYTLRTEQCSPVLLGVQLQGTAFRLFLESKHRALDAATKLAERNLWFDFSPIAAIRNTAKKTRAKKARAKKANEFNTFSKTFYYQYVEISPCSLERLLDVITGYAGYIHANEDQIIKAIMED